MEKNNGEDAFCRDCGGELFYVTSQCSFAHCMDCGTALDEDHDECSADPCMMAEERNGDMAEAQRIAQKGCRFGEDHDPREHDHKEIV